MWYIFYPEIPQGSQPLEQGDGRPCSPPSKAHRDL
jgi:hypothetical protein